MSYDPNCPTCGDDGLPVANVHSVLPPVVNPNYGAPVAGALSPCPTPAAGAPDSCHDGYRTPVTTQVTESGPKCSTFSLASPCVEQWAYPGLLLELPGLGLVEVVSAAAGLLTVSNLSIPSGTTIPPYTFLRPIPRAPLAHSGLAADDDDVKDPADAVSGSLSDNIRFPVGVPAPACDGTIESNKWQLEYRKGMCGIPLTTAASQTQIVLLGYNPLTKCFHFIPNGPENASLKIIDGKPLWEAQQVNKMVFDYRGEVQIATIPPGMDRMRIKCWGAGGGQASSAARGGIGGYTSALIALTGTDLEAGDKLSVVVGEGVATKSTSTYGFGGASGAGGMCGGGLSGVFKGDAALTAADSSRALIIAGGGGGYRSSAPPLIGPPGNVAVGYLNQAFVPSGMQGVPSTAYGAGGGGHLGGAISNAAGFNGCGGKSYPDNAAPAPGVPGTLPAGTTEVVAEWAFWPTAVDPPRTNDIDYIAGVGRSAQPGRVVIEFFAAPPPP